MKKYVMTFVAVVTATVTQAALVHHWNFDQGTGAIATDVVGGANGAIDGASWATGTGARASYLSFDGTNDRVDPSLALPTWTAGNAESWAVWVNANAGNNNDIIIGNRLDGTTATANDGTRGRLFAKITTRDDSNGRFVFNDGSADLMNLSAAGRTEVLPVGEWYHLAVVRDGAAFTFYVNGIEYSDASYTASALPDVGIPFFMGGEAGASTSEHFNGGLDDVRIYDHALTSTEVTAMIPEPATLGLVGVFGGGVLFVRRRFMI